MKPIEKGVSIGRVYKINEIKGGGRGYGTQAELPK